MDTLFGAEQARTGGVVRRSIYDIDRLGVFDEIVERAKAQDFHVIKTGDQVVVLCHSGSLKIYC